MKRVLILGHGYMAKALATEAAQRGWDISDNKIPCESLHWAAIAGMADSADVVVNAGAFIPKSGRVIDCDNQKSETILGNVLFPEVVAQGCAFAQTPLIHLSTGCLYNEAREYEETDPPLRGWDGYCGTYVGCKLLAEKLVLEYPKSYVLRVRLPFDEIDHPRNYLTKIAGFPTVFDHWNSLTHRGDFAKAALDLVELDAPYGVYHCACKGQISAIDLLNKMMSAKIIDQRPEISKSETAGTRLSVEKLIKCGVKVRHVQDAIDETLRNWRQR